MSLAALGLTLTANHLRIRSLGYKVSPVIRSIRITPGV